MSQSKGTSEKIISTENPFYNYLPHFFFAILLILSLAICFSFKTGKNDLVSSRLQTANQGWVDEKICADCHSQAETFWQTGHANTLARSNHQDSKKLLREMNNFFAANNIDTHLEEINESFLATHRNVDLESKLAIDWCFGSGNHARTWVGTLSDSQGATDLVEFRWSRYHQTEDFGITPGQPEEEGSAYFSGLGLLFDPPKARRCFSCHTSYLSVHEGEIDTHTIKMGVTCQRCHGPREAHVASSGEITDSTWRNATQLQSVHYCAECHRRAEEYKPEEITHSNSSLARFQPVGLVQSPCFQASNMTCLTCHNPHKTLNEQDSLGIWQCIQCHDGTEENHSLCSKGEVDQCMKCHMPKVAMQEPLKFTDHWIRIRDETEWEK